MTLLCTWCLKSLLPAEATRDHLVPRCVRRGGNGNGNIVTACSPCNNERGQIASAFCRVRTLRAIERWLVLGEPMRKAKSKSMRHLMAHLQGIIDREGSRAALARMRIIAGKYQNEQERWRREQERWRVIEMARVGFSPTGDLGLSVPTFEDT